MKPAAILLIAAILASVPLHAAAANAGPADSAGKRPATPAVSAANNDQQPVLPFHQTQRVGIATPAATPSDGKKDQTGASSPQKQPADQPTVTSPEENDHPTDAKPPDRNPLMMLADRAKLLANRAKRSPHGWLFPVGLLAIGYLLFNLWVVIREKY